MNDDYCGDCKHLVNYSGMPSMCGLYDEILKFGNGYWVEDCLRCGECLKEGKE